MLICSAVAIYTFTIMSLSAKSRYPPVNCDQVANYFKGQDSKWETHAYASYHKNLIKIKDNKKTDFGGSMQCFCNKIKAEHKKHWIIGFKAKSKLSEK